MKIENGNMENKQLSKAEQYIINNPVFFWALIIIPSVPFSRLIDSVFFPAIPSLTNPSVFAGAEIVKRGIDAFSGAPVSIAWNINHTLSLISIVAFYMILPFLFFYFLGKWKKTPAEAKQLTSFRKTYSGLFFSAILLFGIILGDWTGYFNNKESNNRLKATAQTESYKSMIISKLDRLGFYAREYFYLPESAGGGQGKFAGFKVNDSSIDNAPYIKRAGKVFPLDSSKIKFTLKPGENDTTLFITAVYSPARVNESSNISNIRNNSLEMTVKVTPSSQKIIEY